MRRRRLPNGRADDDRAGVVDNHEFDHLAHHDNDNNDNNDDDNLATAP